MNDTAEFFVALSGVILLVFVLGFIAGAIITLPFALIGWLFLLFFNLFVTVSITYFNCVVVGIVIPLSISLAKG